MARKSIFAAGALFIAILLVVLFRANESPSPEETAATLAQDDKSAWAKNVGLQMADALTSDNSVIRANALYQTMYFAQHRKEADLVPAVPALLDIYKSDADDQYRIAAAVALHAIGDASAMQEMRSELRSQTSRRVQSVSIALLHEFYGSETFENSPTEAQMARDILAEMRSVPSPVTVAAR